MTHFNNDQWEVTDFGVESRMPGAPYKYEFAANRLAEKTDRGGQTLYDWPVHLAEKSWVDIEAFIEAFEAALKIHAGKYGEEVDPKMLAASNLYARKLSKRS